MSNVLKVLKNNGFAFSKKFGQNFILDEDLLYDIVEGANINNTDTVVEIGAGAGTLTSVLCDKAAKVFAFEIDSRLRPILNEVLADKSNANVIYEDIMKVSPAKLKEITGGNFKVVANLPYYITSPVLFYFLENDFPLDGITVMVQKEVALRMVAKPGTSDYGALTLAVCSRSDPYIVKEVGREKFLPPPSVDSAVVRMDMKIKIDESIRKQFDKTVKCAFAMRRKTLENNLMRSFGLNRSDCAGILSAAKIDEKARGETLDLDKMQSLTKVLIQENVFGDKNRR